MSYPKKSIYLTPKLIFLFNILVFSYHIDYTDIQLETDGELKQTCKMSPSTPSGMVQNVQVLGKICNGTYSVLL